MVWHLILITPGELTRSLGKSRTCKDVVRYCQPVVGCWESRSCALVYNALHRYYRYYPYYTYYEYYTDIRATSREQTCTTTSSFSDSLLAIFVSSLPRSPSRSSSDASAHHPMLSPSSLYRSFTPSSFIILFTSSILPFLLAFYPKARERANDSATFSRLLVSPPFFLSYLPPASQPLLSSSILIIFWFPCIVRASCAIMQLLIHAPWSTKSCIICTVFIFFLFQRRFLF